MLSATYWGGNLLPDPHQCKREKKGLESAWVSAAVPHELELRHSTADNQAPGEAMRPAWLGGLGSAGRSI